MLIDDTNRSRIDVDVVIVVCVGHLTLPGNVPGTLAPTRRNQWLFPYANVSIRSFGRLIAICFVIRVHIGFS